MKRFFHLKKYLYFLGPVCALATSSALWASATDLQATLLPAKGSHAAGHLTFSQQSDGSIRIQGQISGLTPGKHGFHVHMVGDCSDPDAGFQKAQGHFNPEGTHHGALHDGHAGDLGNIAADAKGNAVINVTTKKFTLVRGKRSIVGRAIMVHHGMDDEKTDPAGNSGARELCGVVGRSS